MSVKRFFITGFSLPLYPELGSPDTAEYKLLDFAKPEAGLLLGAHALFGNKKHARSRGKQASCNIENYSTYTAGGRK